MQGKEKVQKSRLKVTHSLEKLQHSQRQEVCVGGHMCVCGVHCMCMCVNDAVTDDQAAQQRKEDKKKAEKEKMLNEPDPEKTRKWEVCMCFLPSMVFGFQNSSTWQFVGEGTQKSLEEDGTQNEADEDKGLNCYHFCQCYKDTLLCG